MSKGTKPSTNQMMPLALAFITRLMKRYASTASTTRELRTPNRSRRPLLLFFVVLLLLLRRLFLLRAATCGGRSVLRCCVGAVGYCCSAS